MEPMAQAFKTARERKRISLSQAAAQTRIKVQYLEMMEKGDFSRMPAPAYAKGFIKLYAEYLGLDPLPLIREYSDDYLGGGRRAVSPLAPAAAPQKSAPAAPKPEPAPRAPSEPAPSRVAPPAERPEPGSHGSAKGEPPGDDLLLESLFTPAAPEVPPAAPPVVVKAESSPGPTVPTATVPGAAAGASPVAPKPAPVPKPHKPPKAAPLSEPVPDAALEPAVPDGPPPEPGLSVSQRVAHAQRAIGRVPWARLTAGLLVVALAYLIIVSLARCARESTARGPGVPQLQLKRGVPAIIAEPEPPYLPAVDAVQETP